MMGCVSQLCLLACLGGSSFWRTGKEKKNVGQKSMNCIWCPLKIIDRQKMKDWAYICEPVSARVLASRGKTSGRLLSRSHWTGKSFSEQQERGGRRREVEAAGKLEDVPGPSLHLLYGRFKQNASHQVRGRCISSCKNFGKLGEHGSKLCNPEIKSPLIVENEISQV